MRRKLWYFEHMMRGDSYHALELIKKGNIEGRRDFTTRGLHSWKDWSAIPTTKTIADDKNALAKQIDNLELRYLRRISLKQKLLSQDHMFLYLLLVFYDVGVFVSCPDKQSAGFRLNIGAGPQLRKVSGSLKQKIRKNIISRSTNKVIFKCLKFDNTVFLQIFNTMLNNLTV